MREHFVNCQEKTWGWRGTGVSLNPSQLGFGDGALQLGWRGRKQAEGTVAVVGIGMLFEQVVVINEAGGFCSAAESRRLFHLCHHGEKELKHAVAARLSLSLTACTMANDIHLLPDRPNSAMTPAAACSHGVQADVIPLALSNH